MVHPFLQVAIGGAAGAMLRYALGLGIVRVTAKDKIAIWGVGYFTARIAGVGRIQIGKAAVKPF